MIEEKLHYMQDAFTNSLARIGFSQPNILEGSQYPITRLTRNYNLMNSLYRDSWIIRRIIDTIAKDMVKNWIEITSSINPMEIKRVESTITHVQLKSQLLRGLQWGRLYGGAAGIMKIKGQEDKLDQPLDLSQVMPGDFMGLIILDRWSGIYPQLELVDDLDDIDYGLPKYYMIRNDTNNEQVKVHHSRVIRFCGPELPYWEKLAEVYWGASVVEQVFDELKKRDNTSWNIAQLIFLANVRVLKMSDLGQLLATVNEKSKQQLYSTLSAQNMLMSSMGIYVMDKEDEFQNFQYSFGGVSEIYELFMLDIAGASEIPASKLFGRSPQGMNSTGENEISNYNSLIEQSQESNLRPNLEKLLPVIFMSSLGYVPDDLSFRFAPVETVSSKDRAELIWRTIESIQRVYDSGIISQKIALKELKQSGEPLGIFTNITEDDINNASGELMNEQPMEIQTTEFSE